jgi:hypothetical protein
MIGVDIVCGSERLADDVVVCRRTAAVRLSMLCCCCQFANLKAFASLLSGLMAVVEQAKLLLSERVVLVIPEILAKTGTHH